MARRGYQHVRLERQSHPRNYANLVHALVYLIRANVPMATDRALIVPVDVARNSLALSPVLATLCLAAPPIYPLEI